MADNRLVLSLEVTDNGVVRVVRALRDEILQLDDAAKKASGSVTGLGSNTSNASQGLQNATTAARAMTNALQQSTQASNAATTALNRANSSAGKTQTGMGALKAIAGGFSTAMWGVGKAMAYANQVWEFASKVLHVLGGMMKEIIDVGAKFQQHIAHISTLYQGIFETAKATQQYTAAIKEMLGVIPVSADDLGASAYEIVSAGITDVTKGITILGEAAKLAVAGIGTVAQATDILTSAINAYGFSTDQVGKLANTFFLTVLYGKTKITDLTEGFGRVAPIAAAAGVKIEELSAATAALTQGGLKAKDAQIYLRQSINAFIKPTSTMTMLLERMKDNAERGVPGFIKMEAATGRAAIAAYGYVGALLALKAAADGNDSVLAKGYGRVQAMTAALSLTGNMLNNYNLILNEMTSNQGAMNLAYEKAGDTWTRNSERISSALDKVKIAAFDAFEKFSGPYLVAARDQLLKLAEKMPEVQEKAYQLATVGIPTLVSAVMNLTSELLKSIPFMIRWGAVLVGVVNGIKIAMAMPAGVGLLLGGLVGGGVGVAGWKAGDRVEQDIAPILAAIEAGKMSIEDGIKSASESIKRTKEKADRETALAVGMMSDLEGRLAGDPFSKKKPNMSVDPLAVKSPFDGALSASEAPNRSTFSNASNMAEARLKQAVNDRVQLMAKALDSTGTDLPDRLIKLNEASDVSGIVSASKGMQSFAKASATADEAIKELDDDLKDLKLNGQHAVNLAQSNAAATEAVFKGTAARTGELSKETKKAAEDATAAAQALHKAKMDIERDAISRIQQGIKDNATNPAFVADAQQRLAEHQAELNRQEAEFNNQIKFGEKLKTASEAAGKSAKAEQDKLFSEKKSALAAENDARLGLAKSETAYQRQVLENMIAQKAPAEALLAAAKQVDDAKRHELLMQAEILDSKAKMVMLDEKMAMSTREATAADLSKQADTMRKAAEIADDATNEINKKIEGSYEKVSMNLSSMWRDALDQSLDSVINGTRKLSDVWDGMNKSMLKSSVDTWTAIIFGKRKKLDDPLEENFSGIETLFGKTAATGIKKFNGLFGWAGNAAKELYHKWRGDSADAADSVVPDASSAAASASSSADSGASAATGFVDQISSLIPGMDGAKDGKTDTAMKVQSCVITAQTVTLSGATSGTGATPAGAAQQGGGGIIGSIFGMLMGAYRWAKRSIMSVVGGIFGTGGDGESGANTAADSTSKVMAPKGKSIFDALRPSAQPGNAPGLVIKAQTCTLIADGVEMGGLGGRTPFDTDPLSRTMGKSPFLSGGGDLMSGADSLPGYGGASKESIQYAIDNNPGYISTVINTPGMLKGIMAMYPGIAEEFIKNNPDVVKELINDNPDLVKKLLKSQPDLTRKLLGGFGVGASGPPAAASPTGGGAIPKEMQVNGVPDIPATAPATTGGSKGWFSNLFASLTDTLKSAFKNVFGGIGNLIGNAFSKLKGLFGFGGGADRGLGNGRPSVFESDGSFQQSYLNGGGVGSSLSRLTESISGPVKDSLSNFGDSITSKMKSWFGSSSSPESDKLAGTLSSKLENTGLTFTRPNGSDAGQGFGAGQGMDGGSGITGAGAASGIAAALGTIGPILGQLIKGFYGNKTEEAFVKIGSQIPVYGGLAYAYPILKYAVNGLAGALGWHQGGAGYNALVAIINPLMILLQSTKSERDYLRRDIGKTIGQIIAKANPELFAGNTGKSNIVPRDGSQDTWSITQRSVMLGVSQVNDTAKLLALLYLGGLGKRPLDSHNEQNPNINNAGWLGSYNTAAGQFQSLLDKYPTMATKFVRDIVLALGGTVAGAVNKVQLALVNIVEQTRRKLADGTYETQLYAYERLRGLHPDDPFNLGNGGGKSGNTSSGSGSSTDQYNPATQGDFIPTLQDAVMQVVMIVMKDAPRAIRDNMQAVIDAEFTRRRLHPEEFGQPGSGVIAVKGNLPPPPASDELVTVSGDQIQKLFEIQAESFRTLVEVMTNVASAILNEGSSNREALKMLWAGVREKITQRAQSEISTAFFGSAQMDNLLAPIITTISRGTTGVLKARGQDNVNAALDLLMGGLNNDFINLRNNINKLMPVIKAYNKIMLEVSIAMTTWRDVIEKSKAAIKSIDSFIGAISENPAYKVRAAERQAREDFRTQTNKLQKATGISLFGSEGTTYVNSVMEKMFRRIERRNPALLAEGSPFAIIRDQERLKQASMSISDIVESLTDKQLKQLPDLLGGMANKIGENAQAQLSALKEQLAVAKQWAALVNPNADALLAIQQYGRPKGESDLAAFNLAKARVDKLIREFRYGSKEDKLAAAQQLTTAGPELLRLAEAAGFLPGSKEFELLRGTLAGTLEKSQDLAAKQQAKVLTIQEKIADLQKTTIEQLKDLKHILYLTKVEAHKRTDKIEEVAENTGPTGPLRTTADVVTETYGLLDRGINVATIQKRAFDPRPMGEGSGIPDSNPPHAASGGFMNRDAYIYAHRGEVIAPLKDVPAVMGRMHGRSGAIGGDFTLEVPLVYNGRDNKTPDLERTRAIEFDILRALENPRIKAKVTRIVLGASGRG